MSRLWLIHVTLLWAFVAAAAGHDDDIEKPMNTMQKIWNKAHTSNIGRQWEMVHFKIWISSNVHRRFVFSGSRLSGLQIRIQAVMSAKETNLTVTIKLLVNELKDSGAPKEDVKNFVNELKSRCNTAHPPTSSFLTKQFFKISVPATYDGALSACHAKGGSLALLASAEEAKKAWGLISNDQDLRFYVMARSLPEHFRQIYPQLLGNEMDSISGPNVKCLTMNPNVVNQFRIGSCKTNHSAMCEKYNFTSLLQEIGVKGFVYYNDRVTLQQAKKTCASIGGALATINDGIEQKEAFGHLKFHGSRDAFIDASKGADKKWYWSGGKTMKFKNWGPSVDTPNERCAVMERISYRPHSTGNWRSVLCASRNAFLCEVRVIPDSFVRLIDFEAMGKYFVGHSERMTHYEARAKCGQLAKIRSKEQLAAAMLAAKGIGRVHIGMRDYEPGKFIWEDNSAVDEELLEKQMVGFNARDTLHRCVVMDEHGRWLTAPCNEKAGYLCEESYQKKPITKSSSPGTFEMDVRYNIPFSEVTRTPELKEAFIKAAESSITRIIDVIEHVIVSGLKSGSTIVTYRFYTVEMQTTFKYVKEAIKKGRVVVYFKDLLIRVTDKQDYNYNQILYILRRPKPNDIIKQPIRGNSIRRRYIIIGVPSFVIFLAISIIILICCIKKRKHLTARVVSVVDMKTGDPEKKGPPADDENLPSYKELEANAAAQPPPYFEPVVTPPPSYVSEIPEVKT